MHLKRPRRRESVCTGEDPLHWWMLSLQLGCEDVSISSDLRLVDWALVHALLLLAILHQDWAAQDNWNHAELLLGFALFEASICIPSGSVNLQAEDECSSH